MNEEKETFAALVKSVWFWVVPLAGGLVDWIVQAQRGMKPLQPPAKAVVLLGAHLCVAMFFGMLCVLVTAALGYADHMALGAAGGLGGHLGVRTMDLFSAIAKARGVNVS